MSHRGATAARAWLLAAVACAVLAPAEGSYRFGTLNWKLVTEPGVAANTVDFELVTAWRRDFSWVTEARANGVLQSRFVGRVEQVPPTVSARHIDGKRQHKLARSGDLDPSRLRPTTHDVSRIEVMAFRGDQPQPQLDVTVECGSGFYIRSLARDLGLALLLEKSAGADNDDVNAAAADDDDVGNNGPAFLPGAGAVLKLRRLMSAGFRVEDCCAYSGVFVDYPPAEDGGDDDVIFDIPVVDIAKALGHLPAVSIAPAFLEDWREKQYFPASVLSAPATGPLEDVDYVRVFDAIDQTFLGVGRRADKRELPPTRPKGDWTNRAHRRSANTSSGDDVTWTVRRELQV